MAEITQGKEKHPMIIYYLTFSATLGGLLFGYDTGIINGALILINDEFKISSKWAELIVASTVGMAAIFSLFAGMVADFIGRKPTIMVSAVIFSAASIVMGLAPGLHMILAGRLMKGAAIGFVSCIVPIYISECAPSSIRGLLITMNQLFITIGIVLSTVLAGAFQNLSGGWRYMLGISVIPGVIQFFCFLFLPESPRYQVGKGQDKKAEATVKQIRMKTDVTEELNDMRRSLEEEVGKRQDKKAEESLKQIRQKTDVTDEVNDMRRSLEEEVGAKGWAVWKQIMITPHVRRALFVGCMLQMFQQFCGINAVIYYSSTILQGAGFSSKLAIWLAVIPATINFLATFIGLWAVESLGRKLVLALSFLAIGVALLVLCAGFLLSQVHSPETKFSNDYVDYTSACAKYRTCHDCIQSDTCGFCYVSVDDTATKGSCVAYLKKDRDYAIAGRCSRVNDTDIFMTPDVQFTSTYCPSDYGWLAVLGMVLFVLGFAPGAGPMPWTINAEIYPQWSRSVANSLATVSNWICNVILSYFFLTLIITITAWGTFLLFCGVCILGAIFVLVYVPETKDKSLEEVEMLFMTSQARKEVMARKHKKEEVLSALPSVSAQDVKQVEPSYRAGRTGSTALT